MKKPIGVGKMLGTSMRSIPRPKVEDGGVGMMMPRMKGLGFNLHSGHTPSLKGAKLMHLKKGHKPL